MMIIINYEELVSQSLKLKLKSFKIKNGMSSMSVIPDVTHQSMEQRSLHNMDGLQILEED